MRVWFYGPGDREEVRDVQMTDIVRVLPPSPSYRTTAVDFEAGAVTVERVRHWTYRLAAARDRDGQLAYWYEHTGAT